MHNYCRSKLLSSQLHAFAGSASSSPAASASAPRSAGRSSGCSPPPPLPPPRSLRVWGTPRPWPRRRVDGASRTRPRRRPAPRATRAAPAAPARRLNSARLRRPLCQRRQQRHGARTHTAAATGLYEKRDGLPVGLGGKGGAASDAGVVLMRKVLKFLLMGPVVTVTHQHLFSVRARDLDPNSPSRHVAPSAQRSPAAPRTTERRQRHGAPAGSEYAESQHVARQLAPS